MQKIGIKGRLRKRIMKTYKETKNIVRKEERKSEKFWTRKVRQECPMSFTIFNVYMRDMETKMKKEQIEGIVIGKEKIWRISFADDVVLLTKREEDLKAIMKRFNRYIDKKGLTLSTEKSKVMVSEKKRGGGGRK